MEKKRRSVLIVGSGDIARRTLPRLRHRYRIFVLLRDTHQFAFWRAQGARPIHADLDCPDTLKRLSGIADLILHLAPPPNRGKTDSRTRNLVRALKASPRRPQRLVYLSTSGVYGDCGGDCVDETRTLHPTTARAQRRADAERQLRCFGREAGVTVSILRVPGIYAADRLPLDRLQSGTPALRAEDDVFSNHIHADDLAHLLCAALRRGRANRCYNASDGSELKMGDYFDLVADAFGLPRPPRIARDDAEHRLSALQLSFMSESRRLDNRRSRCELGAQLRYPRVTDGIAAAQTNHHA